MLGHFYPICTPYWVETVTSCVCLRGRDRHGHRIEEPLSLELYRFVRSRDILHRRICSVPNRIFEQWKRSLGVGRWSNASRQTNCSAHSSRTGTRRNRSRRLAVRGELVFGIGGFASNLFAVTNVGTTNDLTNLTYSIERNPVFSPDGNKILFTSYRDGEFGSGYQEIYSMNPNGSDQTRLTTSDCNLANYTFSPDSSKIAFICNGNLSTMNADGSGAVLIADYQNQITEPQYSPDGTKIIFIYDGSIWRIDTGRAEWCRSLAIRAAKKGLAIRLTAPRSYFRQIATFMR